MERQQVKTEPKIKAPDCVYQLQSLVIRVYVCVTQII